MWSLLLACAARPAATPSDPLDALAWPRDTVRARAAAPYVLLPPGESVTLLEADGPGRVLSIWITLTLTDGDSGRALREPSLRMWWDDATDPAVQVPLGDFFALGHGEPGEVVSLPVVSTGLGLSARWPMPFASGARIALTNDGPHELRVYWQVDWEKVAPEAVGPYRFQAAWRREPATEKGRNFVVADLRGQGNYVGTVLAVDPLSPGWWGEGDDLLWIDGSAEPTLHGTGTEDFVHQAWGLREQSAPDAGAVDGKGRHTTIYRWHVRDPIPFRTALRMEMQQQSKGGVSRSDDVSATAFWYQAPPLSPVAPLPAAADRLPAAALTRATWTLPAPASPIDLAALADASRFGEARCAPRSPHPMQEAPGPQTIAGVTFSLLSACAGDGTAVLLGGGERVRIPMTSGGDTLYLYLAASGERGADAVRVTGDGWEQVLRFGRELDPWEDAWPVPRGRMVPGAERNMVLTGGYVVPIPVPPGATWAEVATVGKVQATLYAASRGPAPTDRPTE